ncbi:metabotropic glutamate receptor 7-like protein, partial [Leptotrombidium deliense]
MNSQKFIPGVSFGVSIVNSSEEEFAKTEEKRNVFGKISKIIQNQGNANTPILLGMVDGVTFDVSPFLLDFVKEHRLPLLGYPYIGMVPKKNIDYDLYAQIYNTINSTMKAVDFALEKLGLNFVQIIIYAPTAKFLDEMQLEEKFDICVSNAIAFNAKAERKDDECNRIVDELLTTVNAKGVILILPSNDIQCILRAAQKKKKHYFQWIIPEFEQRPMQESPFNVSENVIVIQKKLSIYNTTDFCENHLDKLRVENNTRNPYFKELWQQIYNCDLKEETKYGRKCSKDLYQQKLSEAVCDGAHVSELIISFLVYGMALRSAWQENCNEDEKLCDKLRRMDR